MARSPDFSAEGVTRIVDRLEDEAAARRQAKPRAPITLSTGRWVRCPDCRDLVNDRPGCKTCGGSGDVPETKVVSG